MNSSIAVVIRHKPGRKRLVLRALASVRHQTFARPEIYLLLMAPVHEPAELAYLHGQIAPTRILPDALALTTLLRQSPAEQLAILDDDDSWAPEYLARLASAMTPVAARYPSLKAVACHVNLVTEIAEKNRLIIDTTRPWNHELAAGPLELDIVRRRHAIPISSCLFDKSAFLDIVEQHELASPDFFWPYFIHFLGLHDVWIVPEAMAFYHHRETTDLEYGNYNLIQRDLADIHYRLKLHSLLRRNIEAGCIAQLLRLATPRTERPHHA